MWSGIGNYHSHTLIYNLKYQGQVSKAAILGESANPSVARDPEFNFRKLFSEKSSSGAVSGGFSPGIAVSKEFEYINHLTRASNFSSLNW